MIKIAHQIRILLLLGWLSYSIGLNAQDFDARWAIKPSYSLLQYSGELGNHFFDFNQRNEGGGISMSRYLNSSLDLLMGIDYYRLNISGSINDQLYTSQGNLFSPSISVNYKFYNDYLLDDSVKLKPYIGIGAGYLIGSTKGIGYDLQGDPFKHFIDEVSMNMLVGVKYDISRRISVFIELNTLLATTEELDGAAIDRKKRQICRWKSRAIY